MNKKYYIIDRMMMLILFINPDYINYG